VQVNSAGDAAPPGRNSAADKATCMGVNQIDLILAQDFADAPDMAAQAHQITRPVQGRTRPRQLDTEIIALPQVEQLPRARFQVERIVAVTRRRQQHPDFVLLRVQGTGSVTHNS